MMDIRRQHECCWDQNLKPIGEGEIEKEPFDAWWSRHAPRLSHLDQRIAEQWIYRHWQHSSYCFLLLESLKWRLEQWSTEHTLASVFISGWELNADFDYMQMNTWPGHPPASVMNAAGTWDYPPIVLNTPEGILDFSGPMPNVRFLLIEGHSRLRYLNAIAHRGEAANEHEIFVLWC